VPTTPFRLFGLPVRRHPHPLPVDPAALTRTLVECARLDADALLARLESSTEGLTNHEAAQRYQSAGPNSIADSEHHGPWRQLRPILASPLSLLLLALAVLNWFTGGHEGALVIAAMVVLSSLFSFVQEYRSSKAAEALRSLVHTKVSLRRRMRQEDGTFPAIGHPVHVPLAHIVPGDIVQLSAGNLVPADVRVIAAKDLFVNEAALTGESLPVEKRAGPIADVPAPLQARNLAFMGTYVASGTATAVVVATGRATYFGGIARAADAPQPMTSFDVGIHRYLWLIIRFMLVMVPAVLLINGLTKGNWMEALVFAIAVGVGMAPEMLPMVITVNLTKGALAMAGKRVIVKRLASIQNLGAMDVLATDKTGTLTQDRVLLERHVDIFGHESRRVLEFACLNSFFQSGLRNLLDEAVLTHAELHSDIRSGVGYIKVDEIPFDFERRRMSVVVGTTDGTRHYLICKGAVEEIIAVCDRAERNGVGVPIEKGHEDELRAITRELHEDGFRVIAVAFKELPPGPATYEPSDEANLTLLGYVAFLDPPKETAAIALASLRDAGVAVKVLTGDNDAVTRHVCRQVGLPADIVLLGSDVDALSDAELATRVDAATVFARLAPQQKARVIRVLRANGHVVGYLGDGINDSPALTAADVGISVDTAADVAKECADIILLEKSLLVLNDGVLEGRRVFGNIIKYLRMAGSSNFGNMFSMIGASALLPFLPMAPVQILVNNLLYDVSQTALTADDVDADVLAKPRRWDISGIGRYMVCIGPLSSLFDYVTFGMMAWVFDGLHDHALFQTGWFVESLLSQTLIVHVIRTGRIPFVESRPSRTLMAMTVAICAVGVWLPFSPVAPALGLTRLPVGYWWALAAILAGYLTLTQLVKAWAIRRFGLT
jgi:Mg2+-importing ATPase